MSFSFLPDSKSPSFGLSFIQRAVDVLMGAKADNLFDYNQVLRVTPQCIVEEELDLVPYMPDVMRTLMSIYAAQYLSAASLMCTVGKIDVRRHLDRLNPHRQPIDNIIRSAGYLVQESATATVHRAESVYLDPNAYRYGLPRPGMTMAREDAYYNQADRTTSKSGGAKEASKAIRESSNMATGTVLDVVISDGSHEATVHPVIYLSAKLLDADTMVSVLDPTDKDRMMKYRWEKSRLEKGFFESVIDAVTCKDMIATERNRLIRDKHDIYRSSISRTRKNFMAGIFSGEPSIAACSSIAVITEDTATKLELALDAELSNYAARQRIFSAGAFMILAVVDREYDRITFYYQNIADSNTVRPDDIKGSKGGSSGPNISEILTAFQNASKPVF